MTVVYRDESQVPRRQSVVYIVLVGLLLAVLSGAFFVWQGFYVQQWTGPVAQTVARMVPFPAGSLNGRWVSYHRAMQLARFQGSQDVAVGLERTLNNEALRQLAREYGVKVTSEEVEIFMPMDASLAAYVADELEWRERRYKRLVALPLAQAEALEGILWQAELYQQGAKQRAQHVLSQHEEIGIPFDDLIDQYRSDLTYSYATDFGYVERNDLPEPFQVAWEMDIDEVSSLIETERTFSYVYLYDAVEDGEGARELVAVKILSFWKSGIGDVVDQFLEESSVRVFLR